MAIPIAGLAQTDKPFMPGDIFIDSNGDTLQVTRCMRENEQRECMVRRLAESGKAPIDPSNRWWMNSSLRGSERYWINNGGEPYSGPPVPLPGTAPAPAAPAPTTPDAPVPTP